MQLGRQSMIVASGNNPAGPGTVGHQHQIWSRPEKIAGRAAKC
jgi:hypothetical protein